ncbi:hypothetical protein AB7M37_000044 [Sinorhizobium fredii]
MPVPYSHVVFTMPAEIAAIAYQNKRQLYTMLFEAAAETLKTIAADPRHLGGELGFLAILHTWGQTLTHHPHLHCLVPGGVLADAGSPVAAAVSSCRSGCSPGCSAACSSSACWRHRRPEACVSSAPSRRLAMAMPWLQIPRQSAP